MVRAPINSPNHGHHSHDRPVTVKEEKEEKDEKERTPSGIGREVSLLLRWLQPAATQTLRLLSQPCLITSSLPFLRRTVERLAHMPLCERPVMTMPPTAIASTLSAYPTLIHLPKTSSNKAEKKELKMGICAKRKGHAKNLALPAFPSSTPSSFHPTRPASPRTTRLSAYRPPDRHLMPRATGSPLVRPCPSNRPSTFSPRLPV
jgi:hypothetical protein